MKTGIVILNYNGSDDTLECVASLQKWVQRDVVVIVVDNDSTTENVEKLAVLSQTGVTVIYHNENCGYAAGNNIGIRHALKLNCDYICVLNNDTLIEEDFLTPCISFLQNHKDVAIVGPAILNIVGNHVQSTGGDIFIRTGTVTQKNAGVERNALPEIVECDYVGGACMVFNAKLIDEIGVIPEQYFLFFEETEWCYKAQKKGYRNVVLTTKYIRHKESASINKVGSLKDYLMTRNRTVFVKRNAAPLTFALFLCYCMMQTLYRGIRYGKQYFLHFSYFYDGLVNRVNSKYPFIKIYN